MQRKKRMKNNKTDLLVHGEENLERGKLRRPKI